MTPAVEALIPQILAYYATPGNEVGGSLHIVLDDGNVEDESVRFCHEYAIQIGDVEGARLALAFLALSEDEREYLSAMAFYVWGPT